MEQTHPEVGKSHILHSQFGKINTIKQPPARGEYQAQNSGSIKLTVGVLEQTRGKIACDNEK